MVIAGSPYRSTGHGHGEVFMPGQGDVALCEVSIFRSSKNSVVTFGIIVMAKRNKYSTVLIQINSDHLVSCCTSLGSIHVPLNSESK